MLCRRATHTDTQRLRIAANQRAFVELLQLHACALAVRTQRVCVHSWASLQSSNKNKHQQE